MVIAPNVTPSIYDTIIFTGIEILPFCRLIASSRNDKYNNEKNINKKKRRRKEKNNKLSS